MGEPFEAQQAVALIRRLIETSRDRKIDWEKTADPQSYVAALDSSYAVQIIRDAGDKESDRIKVVITQNNDVIVALTPDLFQANHFVHEKPRLSFKTPQQAFDTLWSVVRLQTSTTNKHLEALNQLLKAKSDDIPF